MPGRSKVYAWRKCSPGQEPFEMAVEVFNAQDRASIFQAGRWASPPDPDAYRLPANTVVPAKARHVLHQARWNPGADAPTLLGSWGWADRLYLSERGVQGQLTGRRLSLAMRLPLPASPGPMDRRGRSGARGPHGRTHLQASAKAHWPVSATARVPPTPGPGSAPSASLRS